MDTRLVAGAGIGLFPKEHLPASSIPLRVIDTNFVVFSVKWLFHKGPLEFVVDAYHDMVIMFSDFVVLVLDLGIKGFQQVHRVPGRVRHLPVR